MTETTTGDSMLDDEWLAAPPKRSRVRLILAGVLAASLCVLGGALAQKHLGADATTAAPGAGGFPGGLAGGASGFPSGAGGFPGAGQQGADQQDTNATSSTEPDSSDAVIGTVVEVHGDVWVVEDLGGTRHDVTVADGTKVVREERLTPDQVKVGDRVDVSGTTSDRNLDADEVTLR